LHKVFKQDFAYVRKAIYWGHHSAYVLSTYAKQRPGDIILETFVLA